MLTPLLTLAADTAATASGDGSGAASHPLWLYVGFVALVCIFLALDLGVFHREAHAVSFKEAVGWTIVWVCCALLFNVVIYFMYEGHWLGMGEQVRQLDRTVRDVGGGEAARLFLTGYLIEKSLSMDNVFVIAVIFGFFGIPAKYQHRVLFWGILTALVLRGVMIAAGAALIHRFEWIVYVFGALLIIGAVKMATFKAEKIHPDRNPFVRLVRMLMPVTPDFAGQHFITRNSTTHPGVLAATPLLLALAAIETADVVFAVDSIPAIFALTADPFLVFTSNVFAILGLRALYFCLAAMIEMFRFLNYALIAILGFVGVKMLLVHTTFIDSTVSTVVVLGLLVAGVVVSILFPGKHEAPKPEDAQQEPQPQAE